MNMLTEKIMLIVSNDIWDAGDQVHKCASNSVNARLGDGFVEIFHVSQSDDHQDQGEAVS